MVLLIDTSDFEIAAIVLIDKKVLVHRITAHNLSEELLPEIKKLFRKQKVKFAQLKKLAVVTGSSGFSRIRTSIATVNALAFALNIPIVALNKNDLPQNLLKLNLMRGQKMAAPFYDREPNITLPKKSR